MAIIQDRSADSIIAASRQLRPSMASPHTKVPILPVGIYPYVDKVTVWLKRPLTQTETAWIEAGCRGKVETKRNGELIRISDRRGRRQFAFRIPSAPSSSASNYTNPAMRFWNGLRIETMPG